MSNRPFLSAPILLVVIVTFAGLVGCGDDSSLRRVTGSVTFNGEPIEIGSMVFHDTTGELPPEGCKIEAGKFSVLLAVGEKRVEIDAAKEAPGPVFEDGPTLKSYIPRKYNRGSKLTMTVSADGDNTHDFNLQK